ncbi:MAG: DUF3419 family protein [Clostridiales bacterium]|nr:DUF3419 family protein [Clostridiales bacterium]
MIIEEDEDYLNNKDYSLPLEQFFYQDIFPNSDNETIDRVYAFSNECLDDFFVHFIFKDKRVLTVGSSGDQAINAISRGAKDVTIIDANIFTQAYTEYKISAIKNLTFEEFKKAFLEDQNPFDWQIYAKISHDLSSDSQMIWDVIVLNQDNPLETHATLIHQTYRGVMATSRFYKSEKEYKRLQKKLIDCKIKYICSEFTKFPEYVDGKYDIVLFSNIFAYFSKRPKAFKKVIDEFYENHLSTGGKMQINYSFDQNSEIVKKLFKNMFPNKNVICELVGGHYVYYISKSSRQIANSPKQDDFDRIK